MTGQPKVSVIVPVYNAAKWLPSTFRSFEGQSYSNIEWILVDDGSRDRSAELCETWCSADASRRYLVRKENGGASSARNVGLGYTAGEYVLFWDSDDEQDSAAIAKMVSAAVECDDVVVCAIRRVEPDGSYRDLFTCDRHEAVSARALAEWLRGGASTGPYSKLIPRRLLVENGIRFEEGVINEDVLWTAEVFAACDSVRFIGEPLYHYVAREDSVTKSFDPRVLDVLDNCHKLEDFIARRYPELVDLCDGYCARSCWNVALTASRGDNRRRYPDVYRRAMQELAARQAAIAGYCASPKERLLRLLIKTGVYGLLKK